jgi:two-component system, response regulator PdtaR
MVATATKAPANALRVLIVEDDTLVGLGLKAQLQRLGHQIAGQASSAAEARNLFSTQQPDLVLVDIRLDKDDGISLAEELLKQRRSPMIMVSAYSDKELIDRAGKAGVFGYLVKPVSEPSLAAQIGVALRRFEESEALRADKQKLILDLETRKLMERAKGIIMKRAKLSEEDAHKRLQQESQNRRIALADICRKIIESDEMIGP